MEQKSGGTDIIKVIEAVQNDFCKWILVLNRKATNIMARMWKTSSNVLLVYKMQKMETPRFPRQCLEMLYNL